MRRLACLAAVIFLFLSVATDLRASYVPWDPIQYDPVNGGNWVHYDPTLTSFNMYPANSSAIKCVFDIKKPTDGSARGMNGLKFQYNGQSTGRLTSQALWGSFEIINAPKDAGQTFKDILLMVAIDAPSLDAGWSMSLNGNTLLPADFAYIDGSAAITGRPSGYYPGPEPVDVAPPGTSPSRDEVSYLFDKGMVSIYSFTGVNLAKTSSPLDVSYSFSSLPGDATFSAYGSIGTAGIKHTNRALDDQRASDDLISTFSVLAGDQGQADVPEPATFAALGVCLAALGGYIRRRR